MIHNNQPLLQVPILETSATASCGTTGKDSCQRWDGHPQFRRLHQVIFQTSQELQEMIDEADRDGDGEVRMVAIRW